VVEFCYQDVTVREIRGRQDASLSLFSMKNAKIMQLWL